MSEILGTAVSYQHCLDEVHCHMAMMSCIGWKDYGCSMAKTTDEFSAAFALGTKINADPIPDILFHPESYPLAHDPEIMIPYVGTKLDWDERETDDGTCRLCESGWPLRVPLYRDGGLG